MCENNVIMAPDRQKISRYECIIFLAGPNKGANNWQEEAINILKPVENNLYIANPRGRYEDTQEPFISHVQIGWETVRLRRAADRGAILFWGAKESVHFCDRAYAQTTRFELGEWVARAEYENDIHLAIGFEKGFSGENYLRKRFALSFPDIVIHDSLEATCHYALKITDNIR